MSGNNVPARFLASSGELHVIKIAVHVEKEGIAAPTEKESEIADLCHQGFLSDRHWRLLDDNFAVVAHATCSRALNTAHCRNLLPISRRRELHTETEIGNCIAICVDLDLVQRSRFERLARCRLRRIQPERWMHIEDQY